MRASAGTTNLKKSHSWRCHKNARGREYVLRSLFGWPGIKNNSKSVTQTLFKYKCSFSTRWRLVGGNSRDVYRCVVEEGAHVSQEKKRTHDTRLRKLCYNNIITFETICGSISISRLLRTRDDRWSGRNLTIVRLWEEERPSRASKSNDIGI